MSLFSPSVCSINLGYRSLPFEPDSAYCILLFYSISTLSKEKLCYSRDRLFLFAVSYFPHVTLLLLLRVGSTFVVFGRFIQEKSNFSNLYLLRFSFIRQTYSFPLSFDFWSTAPPSTSFQFSDVLSLSCSS